MVGLPRGLGSRPPSCHSLRLALTFGLERDVDAEHQAIVDAAIERDADLAVRLIVAHFERTTEIIIDTANRSLVDLD